MASAPCPCQRSPAQPEPGDTVTVTVVAPGQLATWSTPPADVTVPPVTATWYPLGVLDGRHPFRSI
jgi:hypothetical protein